MGRRNTGSRDGWTRVRFGDVVRLSTERCTDAAAAGIDRYVGLEHLEPGDLRIRSWGNVADGVTFTNRFRPGQVLFGKRRAYQRKVAVAQFDGICSSDIYVFEPANERLLPELLPFICQTDGFFEHALKTSAGSLSPRTNWTSLVDYAFDLPPMGSQRAIAALCAASADNLDALNVSIRSAAVVYTAFLAALTHQSEAAIPQAPLGSFLDLVMDFRGRTPKKLGMEWGGNIPALSAMNVRDGYLDLEAETKHGSDALYDRWMTRGDLRPGDVLFTTEAPLGNVVRLSSQTRFILSQRVVALRPKPALIMPEFLEAVMRSPPFRAALAKRATGSTAKGIRVASLLQIPIRVPPRTLQRACLKSHHDLVAGMAALRERRTFARRQNSMLMSRMIEGQA